MTKFHPSLKDVAEQAGVAVSTVSAILLNQKHCYASQATRQRVRDSADRLGYQPNAMARGLRSKKSNSIGLLISYLSGPAVYTEKFDSIEDLAWQLGYHLIIGAHRNSVERQSEMLNKLIAQRVEGIIVLPTLGGDASALTQLAERGLPMVTLDNMVAIGTPDVSVDREYGGYLQVKHLWKIGRRKLAIVVFGGRHPNTQAKVRGYQRAFSELGASYEEQLLILSPEGDTLEAMHECADRLLSTERAFDAVVVSSDMVAACVLQKLASAGRRVPQDVAVVGFDDDRYSSLLSPPLTTIHQPRDVGQRAMQLLVEMIQHPGQLPEARQQQIKCKPELIVRQSTVEPVK